MRAPDFHGTPADRAPVVILNDSSVARGGATGLALLSARMLRARCHPVTLVCGDAGDGGVLAAEGIEVISLGGALLLDARRIDAVRNGIYNGRIGAEVTRILAERDTPETIYHLHGWSRILSPAVFDALRPVAARTFVHAHDYFLACPNGAYFNYRKRAACELTPLSAGCIGSNCDRRSYGHKLWRVLRQRALGRAFDQQAPWAAVLSLGPWMTPGLVRGGLAAEKIVPLRNPAHALTGARVKAEDGRRLCYIGRTESGKGVRTLCAAARLAGVPLRVIGDLKLQPELAERYPEVDFTGWVAQSEIGARIADCRGIVVPSRYPEPFGLVAAEASRSGLPVLVSGAMPLAGEVTELGLGVPVNSRSGETLAEGLRGFMAMPDAEVRAISERAFAAEETFSISPEAWIDRLEALYSGALQAA